MEIRNGVGCEHSSKKIRKFFRDGTGESVCLWLCIGIYHRTNKSGQYLCFQDKRLNLSIGNG